MQQCRIIYCSLAALHVSSDIFAHHQDHLNCIYSLRCWPATTHVYNTRGCKYSLDALDDEQKYRSKHVERPGNNKLFYTLASCWSFSYIISWCTEPWIYKKNNEIDVKKQVTNLFTGLLLWWLWNFEFTTREESPLWEYSVLDKHFVKTVRL